MICAKVLKVNVGVGVNVFAAPMEMYVPIMKILHPRQVQV